MQRTAYFGIVQECTCVFDGELCMNIDGCDNCERRSIPQDDEDDDLL